MAGAHPNDDHTESSDAIAATARSLVAQIMGDPLEQVWKSAYRA